MQPASAGAHGPTSNCKIKFTYCNGCLIEDCYFMPRGLIIYGIYRAHRSAQISGTKVYAPTLSVNEGVVGFQFPGKELCNT